MNEIAARDSRSAMLAPSPYTNRSALSEAWYRALYVAKNAEAQPHACGPRNIQTPRAGQADSSRSAAVQPHADAQAAKTAALPRERRPFAVIATYRARPEKTGRQVLAERVWRQAVARRSAFRIDLHEAGYLDVLVQQRGRRVHVLAIANGKSESRSAAAMRRAHTALTLHGIHIEMEPRVKGRP